MKARVKATGEIVDGSAMVSFQGDDFYLDELEIIQDEPDKTLYDELDDVYWANMKHQYAGMAMQGILANPVLMQGYAELAKAPITSGFLNDYVLAKSVNIAHELVEKLKSESDGN